VVIDASVIVAVLVADERQPLAAEYLKEWLAVGEDLHAACPKRCGCRAAGPAALLTTVIARPVPRGPYLGW